MTIVSKLTVATVAGVFGYLGFKSHGHFQTAEAKDLLSESNGISLQQAINDSRQTLKDLKEKYSIPGLTVAVSVNGGIVWAEGLGYKDLENKSPCTPKTVMKIASISKCITSVILAKEFELGRIDLDENVSHYVTEWPQKYWNQEKVKVTPRLLASHLGGIRGYKPIQDQNVLPAFRFAEYTITKRFKTVTDAMKLFEKDPLVAKPGEKFAYSNHGYTLLSAVLEKSSKKSFQDLLRDLFRNFGMRNSFVDDPHKIIYDRSRQYSARDGKVENAPYVESSFKVAAAGLLSTSVDLVRFANVLLHSYFRDSGEEEASNAAGSERYLERKTLELLWTPVEGTSVGWHDRGRYGLGWQIVESEDNKRIHLGHTGRSIGTSSVLLIALPADDSLGSKNVESIKGGSYTLASGARPQSSGKESVVVAILSNMEGVSLGPVAMQIADNFDFAKTKGQSSLKS